MKCKSCGAEVGSEYRLCPYCRSELEYPSQNGNQAQPTIIVQNITPTAPNGAAQNGNVPVPVSSSVNAVSYVSPKSKNLTLILAIFGGWLGIDRFYVGKAGTGIIYFFSFGLFGIGWLYDIIKAASGTFKDVNGLPITK